MGWSTEVHESRKAACLQQARQRYRLRKRGYPVEEIANSSISALCSVVAAFSSAVWWKREGRKLQGRDWKRFPVVRQFLDLLSDQKPTAVTQHRGVRKTRQLAKPSAPSRPAQAPSPTPLEQRQVKRFNSQIIACL
jgi:hypothetical protein